MVELTVASKGLTKVAMSGLMRVGMMAALTENYLVERLVVRSAAV